MSTECFEINGIKVINIHCPSSIAVFGIAVIAGSNYETPEIAGISHFTEHMFFKGTKNRSWKEINSAFAKLSVNNNAYTSNSEVFYHTTCPKENIEPVIDIMTDMFFNSTFPEEELEKERGVIKEEKQMYNDDPRAYFNSELMNTFFNWDKGHDVIGTFDTIASVSRDDMIKYLEDKTNLSNFVFLCCGNISSEDLKRYIAKNIPSEHPYIKSGLKNGVDNGMFSDVINKPEKIKLIVEKEAITQSNVSMIISGLSVFDNCYETSKIVSNVLGGGMYSKLFIRIREELGLCYSVGVMNYPISYPNHGVTELYGFTSPENVDVFIEETEKVIADLLKDGIDQDSFDCAKADLLGKLLRLTETSYGKMQFLVRKFLWGKVGSVEEAVENIQAVKLEDCNKLAEKIWTQNFNWAYMVPKNNK